MNSVTSGITNFDSSSGGDLTPRNHHDDSSSFPHDDARTLFIGNLSFFCEEHHVQTLLSQCAHIERIRILYNRRLGKSLMYGFVTLSTEAEAADAVHLLDGHLFMGRKIKVALAKDRNQKAMDANHHQGSDDTSNNDVKVHMSFTSNFPSGHIVLPTEVLIRKIFQPFARLVDVSLKSYQRQESGHQEGHGTLIVGTDVDAMNIVQHFGAGIFVEGFKFICSSAHSTARHLPRHQVGHRNDHTSRMHPPIHRSSGPNLAPVPHSQPSAAYNRAPLPVAHPPQMVPMPMMPFFQMPGMPPLMTPLSYPPNASMSMPNSIPPPNFNFYPPMNFQCPPGGTFWFYPPQSFPAINPTNHGNHMNVYDCCFR